MSSHPDLAGELTRHGVRAELADALAASGLLVRVRDEPVVLTEEIDAISGQRRVLAMLVQPTGPGAADMVAPAAEVARRRFPDVGQLMMVVPAGRHAPEPQLGRPYMRYVLATDAIARAGPEPGWTVRAGGPADLADVLPLLVTALVDGYAEVGSTVAREDVEPDAVELFERAIEEGAVLVAHDDAGFAGHATILRDHDDLTAQERLELFDLFTAPHRAGGPASRLLTSAMLAFADDSGLPLRGYVSGHGAAPDRVLRALLAKGWRQDTTYWLLALGQDVDAGAPHAAAADVPASPITAVRPRGMTTE